MDPDLRPAGAPAQPQAALDILLRRARELSEPEVRSLARTYRLGDDRDGPGTQEVDHVDRRLRRSRALALAIARSGGRLEARRLESTCHAAVRAALAGSPALRPLTRLGMVDDAAAAVTDAAMAILVRDRLGPALRRELSSAWTAVIDESTSAASTGR